jgi:hypothetical protein
MVTALEERLNWVSGGTPPKSPGKDNSTNDRGLEMNARLRLYMQGIREELKHEFTAVL